ncbi:hypothetical protein VOLCADRAFT_101109, partial [Volvox carteri f. nagariensis]
VLLVMPPAYWQDLRELARKQQSAAPADAAAAAVPAAVPAGAPAGAPLAHCAFSFDRTPFVRMHEALLRAALQPQQLRPPPPPPQELDTDTASRQAGLPVFPDELFPAVPPPPPQQQQDVEEVEVGTPDAAADEELAEVAAQLRLMGGTALNPEQRLAHRQDRNAQILKAAELPQLAPLMFRPSSGSSNGGAGPGGTSRQQHSFPFYPSATTAAAGRSAKLLLAAPQNYSADLITSSLARVVEAKAAVLPYCLIDEATAAFRLPTPQELDRAQVVVCSCSAAGILHESSALLQPLRSIQQQQQPKAARKASASSSANGNAGGGGGGNSSSINGSSAVLFSHVLVDEAGQVLSWPRRALGGQSGTGLGWEMERGLLANVIYGFSKLDWIMFPVRLSSERNKI